MKYLILLLFPIICNAVELDVSLGQTQYTKSDNGIWWQAGPASDGFVDDFNLKPASWSIGVTDKFSENIRWRVGYANLGQATSYATATRSDYQYSGSGCVGTCPQLGNWYGSGFVEGVYATVAREWQGNGVRLYVEGGAWVYDAKFQVRVVGGTVGGQPKETEYIEHKRMYEVGPVIGFGMLIGKADLSVRWYKVDANGDGYPAIYQGYAQRVSLGWRF